MNTRRAQALLSYLGYDVGAVDGAMGPRTRSALAAFRRTAGLDPQADAGPALRQAVAQPVWEGLPNFRRQEFACRCGQCGGFPAEPEPLLLAQAQAIRSHFDAPVNISSAVRCPEHNARVGGVADSRHLRGLAMDFTVAGHTAAQVLALAQRLPHTRYAYAIDARYVHMDVE